MNEGKDWIRREVQKERRRTECQEEEEGRRREEEDGRGEGSVWRGLPSLPPTSPGDHSPHLTCHFTPTQKTLKTSHLPHT